MRHASLFTGIGGFDLAAEWMGWENVFQCEIDDYCNKLLAQNFPNTRKHGNIKKTDFKEYAGTIDVLSGGFPCQPYSSAGKRKGKNDERHLWPEMLRVIQEVSPRWVVGENVRGLTNWNGGLVFDEVQSDMEVAGYEVTPFLLPAAGVNAPHERYRIWFIAYSHSYGYQRKNRIEQDRSAQEQSKSQGHKRQWVRDDIGRNDAEGAIANTASQREREQADKVNTFAKSGQTRTEFSGISWGGDATNAESFGWGVCSPENQRPPAGKQYTSCDPFTLPAWRDWPTQPPVCGRNDGIPNRVERIKALGNAVVPQVVYQIFKAIEQYELNYSSTDQEVQQ